MLHRKSLLKYSAIIFMVGILIVILFNVFHVPILTGIGNILVVDDPLSNADIIYLLTGDVASRPFHAVELYKANYTKTIVLPQHELNPAEKLGIYPNPTEAALKVLLQVRCK